MANKKTIEGGLFITLEGGEGVGKSTQAQLLQQAFEEAGIDVLRTREPGGSPAAEAIREVLISGAAKKLGPLGEAALFTAARADHVRHLIAPALQRGAVVICDRYADSTRIYQGVVGELDEDVLYNLEDAGTLGIMPDLTFVLDLPPSHALSRAKERNKDEGRETDRFEDEGLDTHKKIASGFRQLVKDFPKRCHLIDARGKPATVQKKLRNVLVEQGHLPEVVLKKKSA
jgi:dTMP kinase